MGRFGIAILLVLVLLPANILICCTGTSTYSADWHFEQGNRLYQQNRLEEAISEYDEAIRLNPQFAEAYNNRGLAYADLGQLERAIQDYDEAIRLNPQDSGAYNNRGSAYADLGQLERAIQDYDEAIRLNPQFAMAYNNRAYVNSLLGKKAEAIADYEKLITLTNQTTHSMPEVQFGHPKVAIYPKKENTSLIFSIWLPMCPQCASQKPGVIGLLALGW